MDKTPFRPTIRTQADLEKAWRHLMEPLGFAGHSVWMMFIDSDGQPIPRLTQIEEAVEPPDEEQTGRFADLLRHFDDDTSDPGLRVAFLLSRPGSDGATTRDRAWATALMAACQHAGLPCEIVHLATDRILIPLPMDELSARSA